MKKTSYKNIITLPNPKLRHKSETIIKIDDGIKNLIKTMIAVSLDWENNREHEVSAALSAVQIGEMKRVVIIREDIEDKAKKEFVALINPEIIKKSGKPVKDYEGCLSVPDFYGKVPRYPKVKVKAKTEAGKTIFIKAEGFLARVLQHEIDHTNGVVFVDRIKDKKDFYKLDQAGNLKRADYDKEVKPAGILRD